MKQATYRQVLTLASVRNLRLVKSDGWARRSASRVDANEYRNPGIRATVLPAAQGEAGPWVAEVDSFDVTIFGCPTVDAAQTAAEVVVALGGLA